MPTPSDSHDEPRRRDDAVPALGLEQATTEIKKLGETILWFDQQRELLFAQVNGLRAEVARLEAEREVSRAAVGRALYSLRSQEPRIVVADELEAALAALDQTAPDAVDLLTQQAAPVVEATNG